MFNLNINNDASAGVAAVLLLITILIIGATASSLMTESPQQVTESDYTEIIDDVYSEITGYVQIKEIIGKYYAHADSYAIKKIILLITPLCTVNIDLNDVFIELQSKNNFKTIYFNNFPTTSKGSDLFENSYWKNISLDAFGCIVALDTDNSISTYNVINDPTDMMYLTILLPEDMVLFKGDKLVLSIVPGSGTIRTVEIIAPLPMQTIVRL